MIRAVIFDLFHTLVDPEDYRPKDFRRSEVLSELLGANKEDFKEYWEKTAVLRSSTPRPSIEYVKDFCKARGNVPSEQVLAEADEAIGRYQDLAILNPNSEVVQSLELLKEKGLRMGLLSNAEEREVRSWPRSPLAAFFDHVAFSYEIGKRKPDLTAYQSILTNLRIDPGFCAFVGDGGSQELLGARKANIGKIVFMRHFVSHNGFHTQDQMEGFAEQADLVIDDFRDLPSKLLT